MSPEMIDSTDPPAQLASWTVNAVRMSAVPTADATVDDTLDMTVTAPMDPKNVCVDDKKMTGEIGRLMVFDVEDDTVCEFPDIVCEVPSTNCADGHVKLLFTLLNGKR